MRVNLNQVMDVLQQRGSQSPKKRTFVLRLTAQEHRRELKKKFEKLDIEAFERIYRKHYSRYGNIDWKIEAVKMAKSGNYYLAEIARELGKTAPHVCQMFKRILDAGPPLRAAWVSKANTQNRFIIHEGRGYAIPTEKNDADRRETSPSTQRSGDSICARLPGV